MSNSDQQEYPIARIFILCGGISGFVLSGVCFAFACLKLKINHVIKKILLFATIQQAIAYAIVVSCVIAIILGFQNKITCLLVPNAIRTSMSGTQMCVAAISITRYKSWTKAYICLCVYSK